MQSRQYKRLFVGLSLLLFIALLGSYQACGRPLEFSPVSDLKLQSTNGTGYDGKPDPGFYARRIPNLTCPNETHLESGSLHVTNDSVQMLKDNCTPVSNSMGFEDPRLFYTPYNRGVLAINGAVFELQTEGKQPEFPFVEAWCSSASMISGSDVIIRSNADRSQFAANFVSGIFESTRSQWSVTAFEEWTVTRKDLGGGVFLFQSVGGSEPSQKTLALELTPDVAVPRFAKGQLSGTIVSSPIGNMNCFTLDTEPVIAPKVAAMRGAWAFDLTHGLLQNNDQLNDVTAFRHQGIARLAGSQVLGITGGRFGSGLGMGAEAGFVDVSSLAPLMSSESSLSFWVTKNRSTSTSIALVSSVSATGLPSLSLGFNQCGNAIANEISALVGGVCVRTGRALADTLWHQVGLVIQANQAKLYVDGILMDTKTVTFLPSNQDRWAIGHFPTAASPAPPVALSGRVDEVLFWSQALSDREISNYFQMSRLPGRPQTLSVQIHGNPEIEPYAVEAVLIPLPPDVTIDFYVDGALKVSEAIPPFSMFGDADGGVRIRKNLGPGSHIITVKYRRTGTNEVLLEKSIQVHEGPAGTQSN